MKYYQQGDVVLIKVEKVLGAKQKTKVVQEGEHTGHAHRLNANGTVFFAGEASNPTKYVKVRNGGATISHEEHLPITIEDGDYEIRIVRQKDPFTKLVTKVVD